MSGKNNFKRNKKNILMVQYYPYKYQIELFQQNILYPI